MRTVDSILSDLVPSHEDSLRHRRMEMKGHRGIFYMMLVLGVMLVGGFVLFYHYLPDQPIRVTTPHGWVVEKVEEITKDEYGGEVRTVIDEEGVLIESRRNNKIRIIRFAAPNKMHSTVYQVDTSGNRQLVSETRLIDEKISNKIYDYKNKYFIKQRIPNDKKLIDILCQRYGVKESDITVEDYRGRSSFYLKTPYISVYLDRYTGTELVRYVPSSSQWQPVWWLKSARFELRQNSKNGLYEIRWDE